MRLISLVPDDTSDIREAPASLFTGIENRDSRANLMQTVAGVLFGLAGVVAIVMLIGMLRRKAPKSAAAAAHLAPRTILGAVAKELDEVQRASRGGWTPELAGRALAARAYRRRLRHRAAPSASARAAPARRRSTACSSSARSAAATCSCRAPRRRSPRFANAPAGCRMR